MLIPYSNIDFLKDVRDMPDVFFMFARHGRALTGVSPEHAQIVGSV